MSSISLSVPQFFGKEWKYVKECLDTSWVSSAGKFVDKFEQKVAEFTGAKHAIACVNGTSALQVSLRLAGVLPGDEVIVPTLTFIAPINAVAYNGASPIFMDSDDYYNIDAEKTIDFIKNETKYKDGCTVNISTKNKISAIIPVHVWGNAAWMDELILLCAERNIAVVEDASESLGTFFLKGIHLGKHTGTIGILGCLSFNGNKIITTGGGGMILTNDESLAERARYLTTQAKDDPLRYTHNEIGYNFRLTNIQAAIGVAQLEQLPTFLNEKRRIHQQYIDAFENIEGLKMVKSPQYANNNHWMNLFQIADQHRNNFNIERIMLQFKKKSVETRPVWLLNHLQFPYKECQNYKINNAYTLHKYSLCLPSSSNLSDKDFEKIVNICKKL
jgi:aminotransferase in exopolysaccharide biosynthesis